MVELCDLFPEDTSCLKPTDSGDPLDNVDPVDPEPTDPVDETGDATEDEPATEEPEPKDEKEQLKDDLIQEMSERDVLGYKTGYETCFSKYCKDPVNSYKFVKAMRDTAMWNPTMSQTATLMFFTSQVGRAFWELFRYRSRSDYYNLGDFKNEINWYSFTDKWRFWGAIFIYTTLAVSQVLSMSGFNPEINLFTMVIGSITALLLHVLEQIFRWYTHNKYYNKTQDSTVSNYYRAQAALMLPVIEEEIR